MKKIYQEPNVEMIRLVPQDRITDDAVDGEIGIGSNNWFPF